MKITVVTDVPFSRWVNVRHIELVNLFRRRGLQVDVHPFKLAKRFFFHRLLARLRLSLERSDVYWCFFPLYVEYCRHPTVVDYDDPLSQFPNKSHFKSIERSAFNSDKVVKVVTSTSFLKSYLVDDVGVQAEKVTIIPTGINLEVFKPHTQNTMLKTTPVVGYSGVVLTEDKVGILLNAMKMVWDKNPKVKLLLVGEVQNWLMPFLNKYKDKLITTGYIAPSRLSEYINKMDVCLASPVTYGRFSTKLLQYMACEKPIVAFKSRTNELIRSAEAGMLVSSPEEMAEAVIQLINNNQLAKNLGKKGRNFVKEKFDLDVVVKKYTELLIAVQE